MWRKKDPEAQRRQRLFSQKNLERKLKAIFPGESGDGAREILTRVDSIGGFWTPENAAGNRLAIKLRALYLSGSDLAALERAVDLAAQDHRDLDMVSETRLRYRPEWPGTSDQAHNAPDGLPAYEQLLEWLEH